MHRITQVQVAVENTKRTNILIILQKAVLFLVPGSASYCSNVGSVIVLVELYFIIAFLSFMMFMFVIFNLQKH